MKYHHEFAEEGLDERYELVKPLGQGTFGCVVLARDKATSELVAIKQMERDGAHRHYVRQEILNHATLHHPHVVGFREAFLSRSHINIVMEYCSGGTILEFVQARHRLREPLARWFFQQLVVAVDYCHRKGVAIRDIKLDNLLLSPIPNSKLPQPILKICDFGYSKSDERLHAYSKVGTLSYIAPEVLHNYGSGYDAGKADVWSCGIVLYALLTGRFPFAAPAPEAPGSPDSNDGVVRMQRLELPQGVQVTADCWALMRKLLQPDPVARISVADILKDPWFSTNLPANALLMNERYLKLRAPARRQAAAEVHAVVDALDACGSDDECATVWQ